jgi:hypothetical protein
MKHEFEGPSNEVELSFPEAGLNYSERDRLGNELCRVAELSGGHPRCTYMFSGGLGFRCDDPVVFLRAVQSVLQTLGLWEQHHAKYRPVWGDDWQEVITINPAWLTWHDGLLVSMARQMYDSRDFSDMPVLADALEEAGCQDQDILGHCRSGFEHVRGCWVVDLILGKS